MEYLKRPSLSYETHMRESTAKSYINGSSQIHPKRRLMLDKTVYSHLSSFC